MTITVEIKLDRGETADIEIIRSGDYSTEEPIVLNEPYWFDYSLSNTFIQFGQVSAVTLTANFPMPPQDINIPNWWHLKEKSENKYLFSIEPHVVRKQGDDKVVFTYPGDDKHFLKVLANSVNFRMRPDNTSSKVEGKQALRSGDKVEFLWSDGDWYRVTTGDDYRGYVRWRYEDPDTGNVNIYVEEFKTPY